ncbi:membrane protein, partial [Actinomyces sp. S6-Spd3]
MDSLFLWEVGPLRVWVIWIVVFVAQIAIAEINRRWNWTIFALWTVGGVLMMPYAAIVGEPVFGWFPFGKYVLMVLTATMTGTL